MTSSIEAENVVVNINGLHPGSIVMDITVAMQTKNPDDALEKLRILLPNILHPKYTIQDAKATGGKLFNYCLNFMPLVIPNYSPDQLPELYQHITL